MDSADFIVLVVTRLCPINQRVAAILFYFKLKITWIMVIDVVNALFLLALIPYH